MKEICLLIPSCKAEGSTYLKDFLDSIKENSNVFKYIYVLAQNYTEEDKEVLKSDYSELPMVWEFGEKGQFGDNISKIRQYMSDNAPDDVDYYLVADDDMIHYEGAGDYIRECIDTLELPENHDVEFSCMTDSWHKCNYICLKTWNNVDMRCGIIVRHDYLKNHKYYESMRIGEDVTLFIEAFLAGYKGVKFYRAPIKHLKEKKPTGGYTNYYRSNLDEFNKDPKASLYYYKHEGLIKMRPKVFTETAMDLHKSRYFERFGVEVIYN